MHTCTLTCLHILLLGFLGQCLCYLPYLYPVIVHLENLYTTNKFIRNGKPGFLCIITLLVSVYHFCECIQVVLFLKLSLI